MKKERIFTGMSIAYQDLTPAQAHEEYAAVKAQFDALQAKHLAADKVAQESGKEQLATQNHRYKSNEKVR